MNSLRCNHLYQKSRVNKINSLSRCLVTGANGMLGQDLCPLLEKEGYTVIKTDIDSMDITNFEAVKSIISAEKPNIIIHCAAYTNVDKAEEELEKARLINSTGTEYISKICAEHNITLVYISTDYVFAGDKKQAYLPTDKTNPINNYGLTKLEGELAVQKYCSKYFIARTSWLYGIYGKNFVETMLALSDKPEIKVVNDQIGCPTWTVELANGILKLLKTKDYGIHHICGSGQTSWYEFAKEIFKLADLNVNLKPCSTNEYPRLAKRPLCSVMFNNSVCRDWKEALKAYFELRNNKEKIL